jgi:hypothetical protein
MDPHHVDADPDSTYHPDADPDSDFLFDADPDADARGNQIPYCNLQKGRWLPLEHLQKVIKFPLEHIACGIRELHARPTMFAIYRLVNLKILKIVVQFCWPSAVFKLM